MEVANSELVATLKDSQHQAFHVVVLAPGSVLAFGGPHVMQVEEQKKELTASLEALQAGHMRPSGCAHSCKSS